MQYATGSWRPFFRSAWDQSVSTRDVNKPLWISTTACRLMSQRCWSCASARLQMKAVYKWEMLCTAAHVAIRHGSAWTQSNTVLKTDAAGMTHLSTCYRFSNKTSRQKACTATNRLHTKTSLLFGWNSFLKFVMHFLDWKSNYVNVINSIITTQNHSQKASTICSFPKANLQTCLHAFFGRIMTWVSKLFLNFPGSY